MERMMDIEGTEADDKNTFIWRKFKTYTKSFEESKKEILENYPTARTHKRGSMRKLLKILKRYDDGDLTMDDADNVMKIIREMNVEVDKLMVDPPQITDREAVTMFLEKLDPTFVERIIARLDNKRSLAPAAVAAADANPKEKSRYSFEQVTTEAKLLVKDFDEDADYFQNRGRRGGISSLNPGAEATSVKQEDREYERRNLDMLESIKQTVVNMVDRLETGQKAQRAELEQFYKSLPGRVAGAPDSQTFPPRREVRPMRPLTASDLCHYCAEAGTHFISNCPHRRRHIEEGSLRVIHGQDCLANGEVIRVYGNKSRRQVVDESKTRLAQVNYQQAPSYPAGVFKLSVDERAAIERDDGTGYGNYHPAEYDPLGSLQVYHGSRYRCCWYKFGSKIEMAALD
ncbi:hypothetical protein B0H10DRAFT_1963512 [Mycena sp. CBHHK59/15]|nr:hypothetical protein B0H10DRAFT_1963512 [Mycena sp. CBHHK59/15]